MFKINKLLTKKQKTFLLKCKIILIRKKRNIFSKINNEIKVKIIAISIASIISLCLFLQILTIIFEKSTTRFLISEISHFENISYSNIEPKTSLFGVSINVNDVKIKYENYEIKIESANASCNIISCLLKRVTIKTNISSEIKINNNQLFLISFEKQPKIITKNTNKKTYIYANLFEYSIFDQASMKKIASVDKSKIMLDVISKSDGKYIKIKSDFSSKNIFDLDYASKNINSFFHDLGVINLTIDFDYFFQSINEKYDLKYANINTFILKTSDFKIYAQGEIRKIDSILPFSIDGKINIYNSKRAIDYFATMILNTQSDIEIQKMTEYIVKKLNSGTLEKISQSNTKNLTFNIETNPKTKTMFINKKPIKDIIFSLIAYE